MQERASIHLHLQMLQSVINRMAANSASAKTWCITIVSAFIALVASTQQLNLVYFTLLPICLFYILDVYYLALEKSFRASYEQFVSDVHADKPLDNLYELRPCGKIWQYRKEAFYSFSTTGFYVLFIAIVVILGCML